LDAFTVGEISEENIDRMCDAMKAFNLQQVPVSPYNCEKHITARKW
jgi:hypothetical protein